MLAVCAAGRIINPKSARSQVIGAMTMGVGAAPSRTIAGVMTALKGTRVARLAADAAATQADDLTARHIRAVERRLMAAADAIGQRYFLQRADKGRRIIDIPEPYLVWMARSGFPAGTLGQSLALAYEIKLNGLESMIIPIINRMSE